MRDLNNLNAEHDAKLKKKRGKIYTVPMRIKQAVEELKEERNKYRKDTSTYEAYDCIIKITEAFLRTPTVENRKVGDVCYFKRGGYFGKCVISEVITVTDEKGTIVNYKIRPYGKDTLIQVHVEEIFDSFEDARKELLGELIDAYKKSTEKISVDKETKFDAWEAEYQNEIKNQKKVDEQNKTINV